MGCVATGCGSTTRTHVHNEAVNVRARDAASYSARINLHLSDLPSFVPAKYLHAQGDHVWTIWNICGTMRWYRTDADCCRGSVPEL